MKLGHLDANAFSLIELAVVLILSGLIAGGAMTYFSFGDKLQCYIETRGKVDRVRNAINLYAERNERIPLPARRMVDMGSSYFGQEVALADLAQVDSVLNPDGSVVVFGALPFVALGLSRSEAVDCWGNKLTYVMTKDLSDKTKFHNATKGAFQIKTDANHASPFLAETGWAVISHGEDGFGAVKENDARSGNGSYPGASHRWCVLDATKSGKTENCEVSNNIVISREHSDGKDAGRFFFDDVVAYRGKPWRAGGAAVVGDGSIYCWGVNASGVMGTGAPYALLGEELYFSPQRIASGEKFKDVSVGFETACALDAEGKAYCWGSNAGGMLGIGDPPLPDNNSRIPTRIRDDLVVPGGLRFESIAVGIQNVCAITTEEDLYCWGWASALGSLPPGIKAWASLPKKVESTKRFKAVSVAGGHACALTKNGEAHCWGRNDIWYSIGRTAGDLTFPGPVDTSLKFETITAKGSASCGVTAEGDGYCWGSWSGCPGGCSVPTAITGGAGNYKDISISSEAGVMVCAIDVAQNTWCDGNKFVSFMDDLPAQKFVKLGEATGKKCGITADGAAYCWGGNDFIDSDQARYGHGEMTDAGFYPFDKSLQNIVKGSGASPLVFRKVSSGAWGSCALTEAP